MLCTCRCLQKCFLRSEDFNYVSKNKQLESTCVHWKQARQNSQRVFLPRVPCKKMETGSNVKHAKQRSVKTKPNTQITRNTIHNIQPIELPNGISPSNFILTWIEVLLFLLLHHPPDKVHFLHTLDTSHLLILLRRLELGLQLSNPGYSTLSLVCRL